MNLSDFYSCRKSNGIRRWPIGIHFIFASLCSAMFVLIRPTIHPLLDYFNRGEMPLVLCAVLTPLAASLFAMFLMTLASVKVIVEWIADGK